MSFRFYPRQTRSFLVPAFLCYGFLHAAAERKVHFAAPTEGAKVESPFKVEMKAQNLVVEPAAKGVTEGHGHFHIIVDAQPTTAPMPIAKDETHIHYGKGDTAATLDLPVGDHTLTLQFAKGDHVPYDPQIAEQIHIHVTKRNTPKADSAATAKPAAVK